MLYLLLLSLICSAGADLVHEYYGPPGNYVEMDNIVASSMWALGICSCVGIVCNHKNKTPVKVEPCEHDDYYEKKGYYQIKLKDKESLTKLKKDMNEMKRVIRFLEQGIKEEEIKKMNSIVDYIENDIVYKYGKGKIRHKIDDKYYHGVGVNDTWKWNKDNKYDKCFFEYIPEKKLPQSHYGFSLNTYNAEEYCSCCLLDDIRTGRKKNYKVYMCLGHSI